MKWVILCSCIYLSLHWLQYFGVEVNRLKFITVFDFAHENFCLYHLSFCCGCVGVCYDYQIGRNQLLTKLYAFEYVVFVPFSLFALITLAFVMFIKLGVINYCLEL